jgi:hypothetical protein
MMLLRMNTRPSETALTPPALTSNTRSSAATAVGGPQVLLPDPALVPAVLPLGAWVVTAVIAWFAILFTGRYPAGMIDFGAGVLRWSLRVEGYQLLMRDEYPPFSLR